MTFRHLCEDDWRAFEEKHTEAYRWLVLRGLLGERRYLTLKAELTSGERRRLIELEVLSQYPLAKEGESVVKKDPMS
jgi:hypothetical protein